MKTTVSTFGMSHVETEMGNLCRGLVSAVACDPGCRDLRRWSGQTV